MKKIIGIFIIALALGSCSDFLEEYSQDLAKVETYTDLDEVLMGDAYLPVGGVYVESSTRVTENDYFQVIHYMSDELSKYIPSNYFGTEYVQDAYYGWHTWQQDVGLTRDGSSRNSEDKDWNQAYHGINICNMVLDAIDEQHAENEDQELEKSRIKGEAAFLRALYYFELVNLYGKPYCAANLSSPAVPIKLSPVVEDIDYVCNTVEEVYEQIIEDLNLADTCLVNAPVKNHPYRADITAVYLLKSRVYLYMQDWEHALEFARKTLDKNGNLLDLNSFSSQEVLYKSSPEIIFSMGGHFIASTIYNQRKFSYGDWLAIPVYVISDDLAAAYTEGGNDLRTHYYIRKDTLGYSYYNIPYAEEWVFYKVRGWNLEIRDVSDNFLFRTAEAYLNGAEAAAMLGEEGTAQSLLKTLRDNRMVNSRAVTESGADLIAFVRAERQRELCLEGHRWFDLRRYTVNERYPYSKRIAHYYTSYNNNTYQDEYTWSFVLEENDEAYTLALPYEVLAFQNTLGSNTRPARTSTDYTPEPPKEVNPPEEARSEEYYEGYEIGYEDGYAAGLKDAEADSTDAYWDDYYNDYDYGTDQYKGYDDGFDDGYDDGYDAYFD